MRLDLLADMLQTAGMGTEGVDIFIHRMPAETTEGILLRIPPVGIRNSPELPNYYRAEFQAIVRNANQQAGDLVASQLLNLLTINRRTFTNSDNTFAMEIKQMWNDKLPIVYPRTDGYGLEWSIDLHADYVMMPTTTGD